MKALLAVALCALATPAFADCGSILEPPVGQYPTSAPFGAQFVFLDYWKVAEYCHQFPIFFDVKESGGRIAACTIPRRLAEQAGIDHQVIVLPAVGEDGVTPELQTCLKTHEIAHAWGWAGNHPGAIYQ